MYYATAKEMEKLDELAIRGGLEISQMMELAGWHMTSLFRKMKIPRRSKIVIVVGRGNKGGDGLSAARHLSNNGWNVSVILMSYQISKDAKHHLNLIKKMGIPVNLYSKNKTLAHNIIKKSDILIDSLIGYHLNGAPRGLFKEIIEYINNSGKRIIAYDLPSGLNPTSGKCLVPCIRAHVTLALALPKRAFKAKSSKKWFGSVFIADIGIPKCLYDKIYPNSRPRFEQSGDGLILLA